MYEIKSNLATNYTPHHWSFKRLKITFFASLMLLILWFSPITHPICLSIDQKAFIFLNSSLTWSPIWLQFWAILNHPVENWLNLVIMLTINISAIFWIKNNSCRKQALLFVLFCWLFFQVGLLLVHLFFINFLEISRDSPSIVITPIVKISEIVGYKVKDSSTTSFPAGHTFVLIYWAEFTRRYASKKFGFLAYFVALILLLPRLFSGAHWLSDILFTITLSYMWLALAIDTPIYDYFYKCIRIFKV